MRFKLVQNQQVVDERGVWVESVDRFHVRCRYGSVEAVVEVEGAPAGTVIYASTLVVRGGGLPFDPVEAIAEGLRAMSTSPVTVVR